MRLIIFADNDGCARALTLHYYKEGWSNFLGTGSSKMLATAVIVIWEVLDETK